MARPFAPPPYEHLRAAIVEGRLAPNERLVEEELAARLGTTRANVRTGLARLEAEGLVSREHNRGARVRVIGIDEAIEILEVRATVEALAARRAAARAGDADRDRLRAIVAQMEVRAAASDLLGYSQLNANLHASILAIAAHATATKVLSALHSQAVRFQFRTILQPGRPAQSLAEHRAIVESICAGDEDGAAAAMLRHLDGVVHALRGTDSYPSDWR
jgi:DNA-binding GntR family transcriptional regulator